jgi:hypothetical protein
MAVQALVSERELVRLLDSRCLRYLAEFDMRVLAASEFGYTVEDMVAGLGRSDVTIRRHLARLKESLFDFLGLDATTVLLTGRGVISGAVPKMLRK